MTAGIVKSRLDVIEDSASCKGRAQTLLVFLPGAYDTPEDFIRHEFVAQLRARKLAADLIIADTHIGYYTAGQLVQRLRHDIIAPAREDGYTQIWLIGISLGGYGALLYASRHCDEISGMFLMAPFLGNRSLLAQIERVGLSQWQAETSLTQDAPDDEQQMWLWLKHHCAQANAICDAHSCSPDMAFPLYIGYGTDDRFTASNRMLARNLCSQYVMTTHGAHEWNAWQRLWVDFLERKLLPQYD